MAMWGILVCAVACAVGLGGCKAGCEVGETRRCDFPYEPCAEAEETCQSNGTWGTCNCVNSGCGSDPDVCFYPGEYRHCEADLLPSGCCEGEQICEGSGIYCGIWGECTCTDWCDADASPDAPDDPAPDIEDAVDVPPDPDDPDAEDVEDEG